MERIGEHRACLKELAVLEEPYTDERLEEFYKRHAECKGCKVTSPRVREFFASLYSNQYDKERIERREMTVEVEQLTDESEDEDEGEEEVEEEMEREDNENPEIISAVASITVEEPTPSIGDDWDVVTEWMERENEARRQNAIFLSSELGLKSPQHEGVETHQHEAVDTPPQHEAVETPMHETLHTPPLAPTSPIPQPNQQQPKQSISQQILIPAQDSQTHTIINLKDRLSREEKIKQDALRQIDILKNKIKNLEAHNAQVVAKEMEQEREQELLTRARKVITAKEVEIERREKAIKVIDDKVAQEKKEILNERVKHQQEKEDFKAELENMKLEKEKIKAEREAMEKEQQKMKSDKEDLSNREVELNKKGRILRNLYETMKKEKEGQKQKQDQKVVCEVKNSLIHVPLENGEIVGDAFVQPVSNTVQNCFRTQNCAHLKFKHCGDLELISWVNKTCARPLELKRCGSGESGIGPSSKKSRKN